MRVKTIIQKDGTVVNEVIDREGQDCKNVLKITELIGQETEHEITGPDCDSVHETTFD